MRSVTLAVGTFLFPTGGRKKGKNKIKTEHIIFAVYRSNKVSEKHTVQLTITTINHNNVNMSTFGSVIYERGNFLFIYRQINPVCQAKFSFSAALGYKEKLRLFSFFTCRQSQMLHTFKTEGLS